MSRTAAPCASFTTVRYTAPRAIVGAWHMAAQAPLLRKTPGLRFGKLLGTGSGIGFSRTPDPTVWALFATWEDREAWERFRAGSEMIEQYRRRGQEMYSLLLDPLSAHGRWGGTEPFEELPPTPPGPNGMDDEPVVVLTRATIRVRRLGRFWGAVGSVDRTLRDNADLLLTFGIGEVPYLRQGTLSVWRSASAMRRWAYGSEAHREVIRRTRSDEWYAEELFARFRLLRSYGSWGGGDPLAAVSKTGASGS